MVTVTLSSRRMFAPLILMFGLSLIVVGLAINASLLYDLATPPAITYDNPVRVLNNPVRAGDTVLLEVSRHAWNITGTAPIPFDFTRRLVKVDRFGATIQPVQALYLPTFPVTADSGDTVVQSRLTMIPVDTPPGYWRLEGDALARHKSSHFYTEPILVIGA